MRTQREMARHAFDEVCKARDEKYVDNEPERNRFRAYCMKTPSMIQRFGLPQTLAFLKARRFDAAGHYLRVLQSVVNEEDLLNQAVSAGLEGYFAHTRAALTAAGWLRRFAQAELPVSKDSTAQPEV